MREREKGKKIWLQLVIGIRAFRYRRCGEGGCEREGGVRVEFEVGVVQS